MADRKHHTSPDDPADHGHHGHHILPRAVLLRTFGALVLLTVITVVLAMAERSEVIGFGGGAGSVIVALTIASIKATIVALFFMALKYDNKVNALAFLLSIVFLIVFFAFTFLDTGFRGEFERVDARAIDQIRLEQMEMEAASEAIEERFRAEPVVSPGDTTLIAPATGG